MTENLTHTQPNISHTSKTHTHTHTHTCTGFLAYSSGMGTAITIPERKSREAFACMSEAHSSGVRMAAIDWHPLVRQKKAGKSAVGPRVTVVTPCKGQREKFITGVNSKR